MKIKKKIRELTDKDVIRYCKSISYRCQNCPFENVNCTHYGMSIKWFTNNHKYYSDWFLDQEVEIEIESPKLTKREKIILKSLDKKWKYIGRDEDGTLVLHKNKPVKMDSAEVDEYKIISRQTLPFVDLFKGIIWDDSPYLIADLLEDKGNNENG